MASTATLITQRYGEATCTLAVQGQPSALSCWTDQPLFNAVSFQLQLQPAPGETAAQVVAIQGNGAQLQALAWVVQTYVQQGRQGARSGVDSGEDLRLTPLTLTQHQFYLGDLVVQGAASPLTLGMLQLYDLATVLDQFEANALVRPPLSSGLTPSLAPVAAVTPWRGIRPWRSRQTWQVAASLVFAVGVTASIAQLVWRQPQPRLETSADGLPDAAADTDDFLRAPLSTPPATRPGLTRPQAVQAHLQRLWQPLVGLNQPLSYRLVVDSEGAIAALSPLDQVSTNALDQTPLSSITAGEPVFGPSPDGEATPLIISLNPDGRVDVVLASEDSTEQK